MLGRDEACRRRGGSGGRRGACCAATSHGSYRRVRVDRGGADSRRRLRRRPRRRDHGAGPARPPSLSSNAFRLWCSHQRCAPPTAKSPAPSSSSTNSGTTGPSSSAASSAGLIGEAKVAAEPEEGGHAPSYAQQVDNGFAIAGARGLRRANRSAPSAMVTVACAAVALDLGDGQDRPAQEIAQLADRGRWRRGPTGRPYRREPAARSAQARRAATNSARPMASPSRQLISRRQKASGGGEAKIAVACGSRALDRCGRRCR